MTPEELKRLRETCDAVVNARAEVQSLFNGERARASDEFRRTVHAELVLRLLDEVEKLKNERLAAAVVDAFPRVQSLTRQLQAMTSARDSAVSQVERMRAVVEAAVALRPDLPSTRSATRWPENEARLADAIDAALSPTAADKGDAR